MKQPERQYRRELKYRISRGTYEILRQRLKAAMRPDSHAENGVYRVTSLYFDDIYKSAYRDKINGVLSRKKFRMRTYDLDPFRIRLEEKCKDGDWGYKKSAPLAPAEYLLMMHRERDFLSEERFAGTAAEDFFWADASSALSPSVTVDYLREPYVCDAGNVRITFDRNLCAGSEADLFCLNGSFIPVLPPDETILEIKYDGFLPEYIRELLSGLPPAREAVSKFVLCCDRARLARFGG